MQVSWFITYNAKLTIVGIVYCVTGMCPQTFTNKGVIIVFYHTFREGISNSSGVL